MTIKYQQPYERTALWRFSFQRSLCSYSTLIDPIMPIFGNRSLFEVLFSIGIIIIALIVFFATSNPTSVGHQTDIITAVMLLGLSMRKGNLITCLSGGVSFEHTLYFHKLFGIVVVMGMIVHGCRQGLGSSASGSLLGIAMAITSASYLFHKWNFQYFYYFHVGMYCLIVLLAGMHGATFTAFSFIPWIVDLVRRYGISSHTVTAKARLLTPHVLRIEYPKVYEETAVGQYVFLAVKAINRWEYHPFTLCASPNSTTTIFYIQVNGDWTRKLKQLTLDHMDGEGGEGVIEMSVEGPYGSLSVDILDHERYPVVMLIAGGIGVTPLLNLLSTLLSQCQKGRANALQKVIFVWSVRDKAMGDAIYEDFLAPIVDDSAEIHQSYAYSSSLSHKQKTGDDENGGALNIPRKGLFSYYFHCTDPTYIPTAETREAPAASSPGKSKVITTDPSKPEGVTSPLHHSSSSSSSLAAINGNPNSQKEETKPIWIGTRMSVANCFHEASAALSSNKNTATSASVSPRVAVFSCGSEPLLDEIRIVQQQMNKQSSKTNVRFDLHEEMFAY